MHGCSIGGPATGDDCLRRCAALATSGRRPDLSMIQLRFGHASLKTTFDICTAPHGDRAGLRALDQRLQGGHDSTHENP